MGTYSKDISLYNRDFQRERIMKLFFIIRFKILTKSSMCRQSITKKSAITEETVLIPQKSCLDYFLYKVSILEICLRHLYKKTTSNKLLLVVFLSLFL